MSDFEVRPITPIERALTAHARDGFTLLKVLPEGETVVGIVTHKDWVIVATSRGVFRVQGNKLVQLAFEIESNVC